LLERNVFADSFHRGIHLLDGATSTLLIKAGMPRGCCQEAWILEHPEVLIELQCSYHERYGESICFQGGFSCCVQI